MAYFLDMKQKIPGVLYGALIVLSLMYKGKNLEAFRWSFRNFNNVRMLEDWMNADALLP